MPDRQRVEPDTKPRSSMKWWNRMYSPEEWTRQGETFNKQSDSIRKGWRISSWIAGSHFIAGMLIAILAPPDILDSHLALKLFSSWITDNIAPGIARYAGHSSHPQVISIYLATMVALMPAAVAAMLFFLPILETCRTAWSKNHTPLSRINLFLCLPSFLLLIFFIAAQSDFDFDSSSVGRHSSMLQLMLNFRLGMGIFGGLGFAGLGLGIAVTIVMFITPFVAIFSADRKSHTASGKKR